MKTCMLLTQEKILVTNIDVQTKFHDLLDNHPDYRVLFTDGSQQNTSVACAYTVNNAFSCISLEMVSLSTLLNLWRKGKHCKSFAGIEYQRP